MAALSDPRAFLSAQEKRTAQMAAMGIEETDINTKDLVLGGGAKKGSKSGPKGGGAAAKGEERREGKGQCQSVPAPNTNIKGYE